MPTRRSICCLWALAAAMLAGCAHTPAAGSSRGSTRVLPAGVPAAAAVPASGSAPVVMAAYQSVAAQLPPGVAAAANADTVASAAAGDSASLLAPPPGDLFDRIRKGFQLPYTDQKAIDRELNWFANNPEYLERTFGRAEMYMHYIVDELEKRKMPRELALLPVVESAFEPYAYSKARASGLWQFIPGTGSNYGLKQDWWYDGRRDVVESTRAALDYLQALHDEFDGDWLLAVAAYNCGEGNVERAISYNRRRGKPTDFWNLKLPVETRAYVPKLLAMSRLVANPGDYGLVFSPIPDEPYFVPVNTGGQIDMQVVADLAGITRDELFQLNPAFHRFATDPTGPYVLLVPSEVADGLEQTLLSLSPEQRMRVEHYTVANGDTLAAVARRFNTTDSMVGELNGIGEREKLSVGMELRVPSNSVQLPAKALRAALLVDQPTRARRSLRRGSLHIVRRGDTLYSIARRSGTDVHTLARLNDMAVNDTLRAGQRLVLASSGRGFNSASSARSGSRSASSSGNKRVTYTVRRGDTLYSIARILQVSVNELLGWNGMSTRSVIKPGQKLVAFVSSRG
jgi:membrane-bound lytic murein transglycosylase D